MRGLLRWTGRVVGGVVTVLLVAVAAAYAVSQRQLNATFAIPTHALSIAPNAASPEMVASGAQLVKSRGCVDCHGPGLAGQTMMDSPVFARVAAANLTPGGAERSDDDWERAIRHGVRRDGSPLLVMPSDAYSGLSDEEVAAIVAYARTLPAAKTPLPAPSLGPIARGLLSAGKLPFLTAAMVDHANPHPARVAAEPTPAFGEYLVAGCRSCHGPGLSGSREGVHGGTTPPKNLTPDVATGIGTWGEEQFVTALRTGTRPDGTQIDSLSMPIAMTRAMTGTELRALYRYLRTVPAKAYGNQ